jgi:hypothetical protein
MKLYVRPEFGGVDARLFTAETSARVFRAGGSGKIEWDDLVNL